MRRSWVAVALFRVLRGNLASGIMSGLGGVDRTHVIETSDKGGKEKMGGRMLRYGFFALSPRNLSTVLDPTSIPQASASGLRSKVLFFALESSTEIHTNCHC